MKRIFLTVILYICASYPFDEQLVDYTLHHKIILCTGPSYGKKELLCENIKKDLNLIPYKKIFIATNDTNNLSVNFESIPMAYFYFPAWGKQLDCLNSIIHSLKMVAADPDCADDDIILFKYETVFITDIDLVRQTIKQILQGYDIAIKYWLGCPQETFPGRLIDYYLTDSFFITVKAARNVMEDINGSILYLTSDYQTCEEFFTKYIMTKISNVYRIDHYYSSSTNNELGFNHI